jgi:hypothetical protein
MNKPAFWGLLNGAPRKIRVELHLKQFFALFELCHFHTKYSLSKINADNSDKIKSLDYNGFVVMSLYI